MPFIVVNQGLLLSIPTQGTRNWGPGLLVTWQNISKHKHSGSGDGTQIDATGIANNSITEPKLSRAIGLAPVTTVQPNAVAIATLDLSLGMRQKLDLSLASGDVTLTLSNPLSGVEYQIVAVQGVTPRNIIWPAAVKWANGVAPILSSTTGAIDKIWLYYDGTNYFGDWDVAYA